MIDRRSIVRALVDRRVSDWVLTERHQDLAVADDHAQLRRRETRTQWTLVVHDDGPTGRGSARVVIDAIGGRARDVVDQAMALAAAVIGPAWQTAPLAAPAKMQLDDPALARADLGDAAVALARTVRPPDNTTVASRIHVMREQVDVQSRGGLHASWSATHVRGSALVAMQARSLEIAREARRAEDLELGEAAAAAGIDLRLLATAGVAIAGPCAVVLRTDALLHGGGFGMWGVFATQADAETERQGLTRYRIGSQVAPGAANIDEPLVIASDGALDFRTGSLPIGDDGDAVRRFPIVDGGVAVGLALTPREAAMRTEDPNGGVRNLIVAPGGWNGEIADGPRVVEVRRLGGLAIDAFTGDASVEISLGIDHVRGEARPFTGGTLRLDLITALALARRSSAVVTRGPYEGPASVWIDGAELLA
jgi:predicted Zn-dependent protease